MGGGGGYECTSYNNGKIMHCSITYVFYINSFNYLDNRRLSFCGNVCYGQDCPDTIGPPVSNSYDLQYARRVREKKILPSFIRMFVSIRLRKGIGFLLRNSVETNLMAVFRVCECLFHRKFNRAVCIPVVEVPGNLNKTL